jgi:metal-responsive CopG/Arc/MetJ family transcriptional regulator
MFGKKVKLDKELFEKAEALMEIRGYSSIQELISHLIEKEFEEIKEEGDENAIEKLKGLGYIS